MRLINLSHSLPPYLTNLIFTLQPIHGWISASASVYEYNPACYPRADFMKHHFRGSCDSAGPKKVNADTVWRRPVNASNVIIERSGHLVRHNFLDSSGSYYILTNLSFTRPLACQCHIYAAHRLSKKLQKSSVRLLTILSKMSHHANYTMRFQS